MGKCLVSMTLEAMPTLVCWLQLLQGCASFSKPRSIRHTSPSPGLHTICRLLVLQSCCPLATSPRPPQPSYFTSQPCSLPHTLPVPPSSACAAELLPLLDRPNTTTAVTLRCLSHALFPPSSLLSPTNPSLPPSLAAVAELLPPRDRPKTTTAVALRFLSHALGMPNLRSKEAEAELAQQRQAAKANRRAREAARDEVWQ